MVVKNGGKVTNRFRGQALVMKSLAHPTRLFIVDELSRGERCVCELTAMIGDEMPTISRHLSLLKNAGILEDEKRGSQVFYRLRKLCVLNFFHCIDSVSQCDRKSECLNAA
jgi:ArsR family transcriptional regulator